MNPPLSDFTVPFDGTFRVAAHATVLPDGSDGKRRLEQALAETLEALPLAWPEKSAEELAAFDEHVRVLEEEES